MLLGVTYVKHGTILMQILPFQNCLIQSTFYSKRYKYCILEHFFLRLYFGSTAQTLLQYLLVAFQVNLFDDEFIYFNNCNAYKHCVTLVLLYSTNAICLPLVPRHASVALRSAAMALKIGCSWTCLAFY
jgi:hypothetical protein